MDGLGVCVGILAPKVVGSCSGFWSPSVGLAGERLEDSWAWGQAGTPAGLLGAGT